MTSASRRNEEEEISEEDLGGVQAAQARRDLRAFFLTLDAAASEDLGQGPVPPSVAAPVSPQDQLSDDARSPALEADADPAELQERASDPESGDAESTPVDDDATPEEVEDHSSGIERIRRAIEEARRQRAEAEALAKSVKQHSLIRAPSPDADERLTLAEAAISTQRHWLDEAGSRRRPNVAGKARPGGSLPHDTRSVRLKRSLLKATAEPTVLPRSDDPPQTAARFDARQDRLPSLFLPPSDPPPAPSELVPTATQDAPGPGGVLPLAVPVLLAFFALAAAFWGTWITGNPGEEAAGTGVVAVATTDKAVFPTGAGTASQGPGASADRPSAPTVSTVDRAPAPTAPSSPAAIEAALAIDAGARAEVEILLVSQGYLAVPGETGFGVAERRAIAAWQADRGLAATGYLDMETFALMMSVGKAE